LMTNSSYFRDDLIRAAEKEDSDRPWEDNHEALSALAKLDWAAAEPILKRQASSGSRSALAALSVLYKHAVETKNEVEAEALRGQLKPAVIASNVAYPIRYRVFDVLFSTEWVGKDDWVVSILSVDPNPGYQGFLPIFPAFAARQDPDKWIPIISRLVDSSDQKVHNAAVLALLHQNGEYSPARRDEILPLLPWLSNPEWASPDRRSVLLGELEHTDVPESVSGLLWILQNERDLNLRIGAANAMKRYRDPAAVPVLRDALEREKSFPYKYLESPYRKAILAALFACGGVSEAEMTSDIEAYARTTATTHTREAFEKGPYSSDTESVALETRIGEFFSNPEMAQDALVAPLLRHAQLLAQAEPDVSNRILQIVHSWPVAASDLDIVERIGNGTAGTDSIHSALQRREKLRANTGNELTALSKNRGGVLGMAAAILDEDPLNKSILTSRDVQAQRALLACNRLIRGRLPLSLVTPLLASADSSLSRAAERYLESEDSAEARRAIVMRHPGELTILGRRLHDDTGDKNDPSVEKSEERLVKEIKGADSPVEIFALLNSTYSGNVIVRLYANRATITRQSDDARYEIRRLEPEEAREIKEIIREQHADNLAPLIAFTEHGGGPFEYVHLTRTSGRRVFVGPPDYGIIVKSSPYAMVKEIFDRLSKRGDFEERYFLADRIKNLEVLFTDDNENALAVWKSGNDLRVAVRRTDDNEAGAIWKACKNGKPSGASMAPDGFSDDIPWPYESSGGSPEMWRARLGDYWISAAEENDRTGLWKKKKEAVSALIIEGNYSTPLTTADGRWLIASKSLSDSDSASQIVRINLASGRELKTDIQAEEVVEPLAYSPALRGVIVMRAKNGEDGHPLPQEYRLLDPENGESKVVSGELRPLLQQSYRPLQPTANADEAWAAIYSEKTDATEVGRYNLRTLTFRPELTLPSIKFGSMDMWVDEQERKVYITYNGQLLRMGL
jgi:hypothetical protein